MMILRFCFLIFIALMVSIHSSFADSLCWGVDADDSEKPIFLLFSKDIKAKTVSDNTVLNLKVLANAQQIKVSQFSMESPGNEIRDQSLKACPSRAFGQGNYFCSENQKLIIWTSSSVSEIRASRQNTKNWFKIFPGSCENLPADSLDLGILAKVVKNKYPSVHPPHWECALKKVKESPEVLDTIKCKNSSEVLVKLACMFTISKSLDPGYGRTFNQHQINYCARMSDASPSGNANTSVHSDASQKESVHENQNVSGKEEFSSAPAVDAH